MILKIPKQVFIIVRLTKLKKGYQDLVYQGNLPLYFTNYSMHKVESLPHDAMHFVILYQYTQTLQSSLKKYELHWKEISFS